MNNLPTDIRGPGKRLIQTQATARSGHVVARNLVQYVKSSSTKGKAAMGDRETEARQCAKVKRHLFIGSDDKAFKETI